MSKKNYDLIATVDIDIKSPIVDDTSFDNLLIVGPSPSVAPATAPPDFGAYRSLDEVTEAELDLHYVHSTGCFPEAVISPPVSEWYDRLTEANRRRHIYDQKLLQKYIERIKVRLIYNTLAGSATTCEMTKMKRAWLFFRYLPFKTAVAEILKIMKLKAERRFFPDRIG